MEVSSSGGRDGLQALRAAAVCFTEQEEAPTAGLGRGRVPPSVGVGRGYQAA